jgi:N-acetyl-1-D-myo-inositol-2-amino-2-deoxy-alpha-D-glucopyranoside deacetylase
MAAGWADRGSEAARPTLLSVFAHPDDEEFGTAGALLACANRGVNVVLVSATSGEAGEISDPVLASPENLAEVREDELRTACALLGFAEPIFLRYPDGGLDAIDPAGLRDDIAAIVRRLRPRVVVTFDANGGYGHLDHMAIHRATVAALATTGDPTYRPDLGAPHFPAKLYATAYPRSLLAAVNADLARYGIPPISFGGVQTIGADEFGTADVRVTTVVPVDHLWERRWASLRAHRTQDGANNPFLQVPEVVVRGWMTDDCFVRLHPPPDPRTPLPDESDLWQGLPLPDRSSS